MIEAGLREYLLSVPAVSAIFVDRVHPLRLPQGGTLPAVTYQRIAGSQDLSQDGAVGLSEARVQFDVWADRYQDMAAGAGALKTALVGYRGAAGDSSVAAVRVVNDLDVPESEPALWRRMVEIAFLHS